MATPESKISPMAFKVNPYQVYKVNQLTVLKASAGTLFATAMILAVGRFYIRIKTYNRFLVDDFLLLFACLTLIASMCLTYIDIASDIYVHDYLYQVIEDEKLQAISTVLFWATIFAVKFSFLAFFKGLIKGVGRLDWWWWFIFVMTIPAAAICMCVNFIACPYIGIGIVNCADNTHLDKELALLKATTILDIVTDILSEILFRILISNSVDTLLSHLYPGDPLVACQDYDAPKNRSRCCTLSQHRHDHRQHCQSRISLYPWNTPHRPTMGPILGRSRGLRRRHDGLSQRLPIAICRQ